MHQLALEALADELGLAAGAIEREVRLRVDAALADIARRDAERELRVVLLERRMAERLAALRDGAPGNSVTLEDVAPMIEAQISERFAGLTVPKDGTSVTVDDVAPLLRQMVAEIEVPKGEPGTSVTLDDVTPLLRQMVAEIEVPKGEPGTSVTLEDVAPVIAAEVARQVAAIPAAEPGKSITVEEVEPVIAAEVARQVAALPVPEPGKSVTVADVEPLLRDMVAQIEIPKGERGDAGAPGTLPVVKAWEDRVYYEGEVASRDGATWQASKDTGRAPPHEDWACLARAGSAGKDAESFAIEGTYDPARTDYKRLSVVILEGSSFVARRDNPGECPGDGWQLHAMRGKTGKPGENSRVKGDPGPAGPKVRSMDVSDDGLLVLTNADGSTVELDLYPLLSKLQQG